MSLAESISNDLNSALKKGQKGRVLILRMIKSAIRNMEIEKGKALSDDEISGVLRTYAKRAKESIEQFSEAGRTELAEKEKEELAVIQDYLPKQLGEDELRGMITDIIQKEGSAGLKDMGKVMKAVMAAARGQVDGKLANKIVKEILEA
jgi:uncharacterized protein YqeY